MFTQNNPGITTTRRGFILWELLWRSWRWLFVQYWSELPPLCNPVKFNSFILRFIDPYMENRLCFKIMMSYWNCQHNLFIQFRIELLTNRLITFLLCILISFSFSEIYSVLKGFSFSSSLHHIQSLGTNHKLPYHFKFFVPLRWHSCFFSKGSLPYKVLQTWIVDLTMCVIFITF